MSRYTARSEFARLKEVLLCKPPRGIEGVEDPGHALHSAGISYDVLAPEIDEIKKGMTEVGIEVFMVDASPIEGADKRSCYNLMYVRDLFWACGEACIIARMQPAQRRDESLYIKRTLQVLGVHAQEIGEEGATFEGADILWVSDNKVMIGVGSRTNEKGFEALSGYLKEKKVDTIRVGAPTGSLHLLGSVQIVDKDLSFVRTESAGREIGTILEENGMRVVEVPETEEVTERYAMNIVTIAPRKVIVPKNVPGMKKLLVEERVDVVKEIGVKELIKGGGSLGCAAGILLRNK